MENGSMPKQKKKIQLMNKQTTEGRKKISYLTLDTHQQKKIQLRGEINQLFDFRYTSTTTNSIVHMPRPLSSWVSVH